MNIRVVGLPEKIEGGHPTIFMETFLVEVFGEGSFPHKPTVGHAHRTLRPPQKNEPPRVMIACLHHYRAKELILPLSGKRAGQLTYQGQKISFCLDLSIELDQRRAAFNPVKKQFQVAGVKYSLAYPAMLWLTINSSKHEFRSSQDALAFVKAKVEKTGKAPAATESDDMPTLED